MHYKIMVANCGSKFRDFYYIYSGLSNLFFILDSEFEKIAFHTLANPKNPNRNLDCIDYCCEIRLTTTGCKAV